MRKTSSQNACNAVLHVELLHGVGTLHLPPGHIQCCCYGKNSVLIATDVSTSYMGHSAFYTVYATVALVVCLLCVLIVVPTAKQATTVAT